MLVWTIGGLIAGMSVYVAIRIAPQETLSLRTRILSIVMAVTMVSCFGISLFHPQIWRRVHGAKLPKHSTAAATGTIVAIILLVIVAGISIWLMRGWF